tara:strand:- start:57 stop:167 length:111 start_codon:yes stop_codon:yes gene_type:complete
MKKFLIGISKAFGWVAIFIAVYLIFVVFFFGMNTSL